jgi:hypothetical protein
MKELFEHWNKFLIAEEMPTQKAVDIATGGGKEMVLRLPKFRISEQWGTPGSDDRKIIEMFTSKISGNSLSEKINSLNSFVSDCDEACAQQKDVSEILASLVFLDSLSSVVYDFNPMTGGFLFESLLAALFGGDAKQIETGAAGSDQDVADILLPDGRPASLKLFYEGGSQYIKGSGPNLRKDIQNYNQPMIYIIGIKNRNAKEKEVLSFDFYEFTVGSYRDGIKGQYDVSDIDYGINVGEVIGVKKRGRRSRDEFDDEGNPIPRTRQKETTYFIGNLNFGGSRKQMQEIAIRYTERLGSVLFEIYQQLDLLSQNVNEYYLQAPDAKDSGLRARQNAQTLKKDTEELS